MFLNIYIINILLIAYLSILIKDKKIIDNGIKTKLEAFIIFSYLFCLLSYFTYIPYLFIIEYQFPFILVLIFLIVNYQILKIVKYFIKSFYEDN